ncbi:unnamed protein product, partial [Polarella glacialis]
MVFLEDDKHGDLVRRMRAFQRRDERRRLQWAYFCDTNGSGVRDPARHPEAFLLQFLEVFQAGELPEDFQKRSDEAALVLTLERPNEGMPEDAAVAERLKSSVALLPIAEESKHAPRGWSALHAALIANDSASAATLIEAGDAVLLNQKSSAGHTPLMLLAMGRCQESLIWRLLERSGSASVAARSEQRFSAADYASEEESRRLPETAERLRALEAAAIQRTADCRCPVCGDLLSRRPRLAFFWERADRAEEENPLLRQFFSDCRHQSLMQPRFHQINDTKRIRKEISESMSVLLALEQEVPDFGRGWHVVDLCCGRSVTAALVALRYPGVTISAVDRLEPRFLPHFAEAEDGGGVQYVQLDVLGATFISDLEKLLDQADRPTALLGMHLCGNLSLRAIEAFNGLRAVRTVVLSPCCLPAKAEKSTPQHLFATRDQDEQYLLWARHLEATLRSTAPASHVTSAAIRDILSPKNIVICATKQEG